MAKFTINGKEYEGAKYSFNTSCQFEEMGVNLADISKKPMGVMRAYLAISGNMDLVEAGEEIEQHVVNGGNLNGLQDVFAKELETSGFFKGLLEVANKEEASKKKK